MSVPTVSVIIPTYNEAATIVATLSSIYQLAFDPYNLELIVVDGGSQDGTLELIKNTKAKAYVSPLTGRAAQMAYGVSYANANILYFLHADTIPPLEFDRHILEASGRRYSAGCFQIRFDPSTLFLWFFEQFVRFPVLLARGGDQSLFITKELYCKLGGYRQDYPILEDIEIIKRIRRIVKFQILSQKVVSSSRRYQQIGQWRLQWTFLIIHIKYWLGVDIKGIYRYYQNNAVK